MRLNEFAVNLLGVERTPFSNEPYVYHPGRLEVGVKDSGNPAHDMIILTQDLTNISDIVFQPKHPFVFKGELLAVTVTIDPTRCNGFSIAWSRVSEQYEV